MTFCSDMAVKGIYLGAACWESCPSPLHNPQRSHGILSPEQTQQECPCVPGKTMGAVQVLCFGGEMSGGSQIHVHRDLFLVV